MKKKVLALCFITLGLFATAQTRMVLYEVFTGENCGPCGPVNVALDALMDQPVNSTRIIPIKWQVPVPIAPTLTWSLYQTNKVEIDWRYKTVASGGYGYGINSAPSSKIDGQDPTFFGSSTNNPVFLNNTVITAAATPTTPFSINMSAVWNPSFNNAVVSVSVTSSQAFTSVGALVFRLVLVERIIQFSVAPGANGETYFENVVRKSYPTLQSGTSLPSTWAAGQTQTFTINCASPSYIVNLPQQAFVGFIQDDGNRIVWQAARAGQPSVPNDANLTAVNVKDLSCATNFTPSITIANNGPNAITAMTLVPYIDATAQPAINWTGNLASLASQTMMLSGYSATPGSHSFSVNITNVSGGDIVTTNNTKKTSFALVNSYFAGPVTEPFTAATFPPTNWFATNADFGTATWSRLGNVGAYGSNTGAVRYHFHQNKTIGDQDDLFLPPSDLSAMSAPVLTFDLAYAQYLFFNPVDQLDVLVSADCGSTWTNVFTESGAVMATAPPLTNGFIPNSTEWKSLNVPLTAFAFAPQVLVKFVATSDNGNNLYLDNINLTQATTTSIKVNAVNNVSFDVYPNPTNGETTLKINAVLSENAKVVVVNTLGQVVYSKQVELNVGVNTIPLNVKEFATGLYSVMVESNNSSVVKKLTVSK